MDDLIQKKHRNPKKDKRKRLDISATLDRKQKAAVRAARRYQNDYDPDNDSRFYVR